MKTPVIAFSVVWMMLGFGSTRGEVAASAESNAAGEKARQPNVLLIYTDDQGSIDLNCYGSEDLATANRLAMGRS